MNLLDATALEVYIGPRQILADVSLTLAAGEIVALLGPNGSGKTTLLSALVGFRRATGSIMWNGQPIHSIDRTARAKLAALLPQTPTTPDMSVRDFIALGRTATLGWFGLESPDDVFSVEATLDDLDLRELRDRSMHDLSGGQRQRVLVGRALAQGASALLLDEPDTFLDLRQQQSLGQLLRRLARERGIGIVLASHDLNFAIDLADRFVLLKQGRSIAHGRTAELDLQKLGEAFDVSLTQKPLIATQTL